MLGIASKEDDVQLPEKNVRAGREDGAIAVREAIHGAKGNVGGSARGAAVCPPKKRAFMHG